MDREELTKKLEQMAETSWDYGYDEMYFSEMSFIEDVVSFILDNFEEKHKNPGVRAKATPSFDPISYGLGLAI